MSVQKFYVRSLEHEDERRVEQALKRMEGVLYAVASHSDACAEVEFEDDCVTAAEIIEALRELGYDARPAS